MIGHKWEPAEGTIVSLSREQMELPGRPGMHYVTVYDIDVRASDGTVGRARVPSPQYPSLQPGMIVRLEINAKTGEMRLHPHEAKLQIGFSPMAAGVNDDFSASSAAGPQLNMLGGLGNAAGVAGLAGLAGLGGTEVHVLGGAAGEQVSEIVRAVLSGDPASRAAAKEQLRQLAQTQGQLVSHDAVPGGFGQRSPSDRLAVLQQLVDHGQLSQAEFEAKRQQILDEI
jgi:Short C-terminal domain